MKVPFPLVSIDFKADFPIWNLTPLGKSESIRFYDTSTTDASGSFLAVTQFADDTHLPRPGEGADVVVRNLKSGEEVFRESTTAWDSQLGAQVQWHPTRPEVFYNVMGEDVVPHAVSVDLNSGKRRIYPWTVYMLSPDGRFAVSPDLRKIGLSQAGYGVIVEDPDSFLNSGASESDGVYILDLEERTHHMAVSIRQLVEGVGIKVPPGGAFHVFHVKWSPVHDRIMVVLRWISGNGENPRRWVLACNRDGSDIHCLVSDDLWERGGHHPNWYPDGKRVVMNLRPNPQGPLRFCEITDTPEPQIRPLVEGSGSGHPTIHKSGRWLISDAYLREKLAPEGHSPLRLIDLDSGKETTLAIVPAKPDFFGPSLQWRVDLHPSWCIDWRHITFNGWYEGRRAVFLADLRT